MQILDDQGRLFGAVNVVDALVVLLVVTVGVAGAALVFGGASPSPASEETQYGTVAFSVPTAPGTPLPAANDTLVPAGGGDEYTVEEVAYSFAPEGDVHVVASVAYPGAPDVNGGVAGAGSSADVRAPTGSHTARFLAVNRTTPDLATESRSVVLAVAANATVGHAVEPGATATVAGQDVATVTSVTSTPGGPPERAELVGLDLQVWSDGETAWFGGSAVRVNNRLTVVTDDAVVTGRLYRVGTSDAESVAGS